MAEKCEVCGNKIKELFLGKLKGTYIKDKKGKEHKVCFECQKKFDNDKEKILENLK